MRSIRQIFVRYDAGETFSSLIEWLYGQGYPPSESSQKISNSLPEGGTGVKAVGHNCFADDIEQSGLSWKSCAVGKIYG